jgi:NTP pyrophosphatase (non-canonical NTP hydrolase)
MEYKIPDIDTLKRAINTNGITTQEDVAIEKMSELVKAILKRRRAIKKQATADKIRETENNIREEIADVIIMIQQLILIYDSDGDIQMNIDSKLKRLKKRLGMEEDE